MVLPLQDSEQSLYDDYAEFRAHKWLIVIVSPLLLLLGTCGNVLSTWGLYNGKKTSSTFVYLIVIGLADQVILITGLGRRWFNNVTGLQLERVHSVACATTHFVLTFASCLSVFCLATVAVERFAIVWPCKRLQRAIGLTRRCVPVLLLVCLLLNLHWLLVLDLVPLDLEQGPQQTDGYNDTVYLCDLRPRFQGLKPLLAWYDFVLYSLSPLCVLLACNCVILKRLHSTRRFLGDAAAAAATAEGAAGSPEAAAAAAAAAESFRLTSMRHRSTTGTVGNDKRRQLDRISRHSQRLVTTESKRRQQWFLEAARRSRSIRQVTLMLLLVSFFFLATSLPITVLKVLISLMGDRLSGATQETYVRFRLIETSAKLLMYTNHSANFYLYCLVGRRFRRVLRTKLRRLARRLRFC